MDSNTEQGDTMKEIKAIIRPNKIDNLQAALRRIPNFPGMTVSKVDGFTAPAALVKRSVKEDLTDFSHKILLHILAPESEVDHIVDTIIRETMTGQIGDGLVWVTPVEVIRRIRDGTRVSGIIPPIV
ncbi:P-II family nitrogen regulator [Ampullimonas aquatilis]|uniref:P-II family nitrogen regulator n=1 Tax=Ampullimonas aquatilis TaxID=1341549 RepID=UPI003C71A6D3